MAINNNVRDIDQKLSWSTIRSRKGRGWAKVEGALATGDTKAVLLLSILRFTTAVGGVVLRLDRERVEVYKRLS